MANTYFRFLLGFMGILFVSFGITYAVDIYATAQVEKNAAQTSSYE